MQKLLNNKWLQAALIAIGIILCGLAGNAERLPKDKGHYHQCESIKNGIRCTKECLEGEKYCFDDVQNENI